MHKLILKNLDNNILFDLLDTTASHILIPKFNPHQVIDWWPTSITLPNHAVLSNVSVRNMNVDILTDLAGLKKILSLHTPYLAIYQFNRPVSGTLDINSLSAESSEKILQQNGLEHTIINELEYTTISSFNDEFLQSLRQNPLLQAKILN